jgi:hypothetical protein
MAHFAEIDSENKVVRVLKIDDSHENDGENYLANELGLGGRWIQTSYNGTIRIRYAGVGHIYDETLDAFIRPKCHDEAILDETFDWSCTNKDHDVNLSE